MKFNVTDPDSGASLVFEGDQPPTEKQLDDLFAEQSITTSTRVPGGPAAAPAAAPSGPGLLSRLGTAARMLPPVAIVERGARNMINPLIATGRAIGAAAGPVANYIKDVVLPDTGSEIAGAASFMGRGAANLVRPFIPSGPDASALVGGPEAVKAWGRVFNPPPGLPQDNPLAGPITLPPAPLAKTQRVTGKIYLTPAGPRKWTGEGWQRLS